MIALGAVVGSGHALTAPVLRAIGAPPSALDAEEVQFPSASGSVLHGWLALGRPSAGVIILMHGIHADRRSHAERMRLLQKKGYTALAFDFQSHGESPGHRITLGHLEARDAQAAVSYVRQRFPGERIGIIGTSLGGAAVLLASEPLHVNAVVLESVYPDVRHALSNRLETYLGPPGRLLTPFYLAFMPLVLGIHESDLRPIDRIGSLGSPVLILNGTVDDRTTIAEAMDLFGHAHEPKEFWAVEGAGHVDLLAFAPAEYERHVMRFVETYVRGRPDNQMSLAR